MYTPNMPEAPLNQNSATSTHPPISMTPEGTPNPFKYIITVVATNKSSHAKTALEVQCISNTVQTTHADCLRR